MLVLSIFTIMEKEVIRKEIKKYSQSQTDIAKEMEVSPIYLNQFLHGFEGVGKGFINRANTWLSKQKQ